MLALKKHKVYCTDSEVTKTNTPKKLVASRSTIYPPQHIFEMPHISWGISLLSAAILRACCFQPAKRQCLHGDRLGVLMAPCVHSNPQDEYTAGIQAFHRH